MQQLKIKKIIDIANQAGEIAMSFYKKKYNIKEKRDKTPVTEVDLAVNSFLNKKLSKFGYPIISEESNQVKVRGEKLWLIDPLDGTSDFIDKTGDFSIMIGFLEKKRPVLGVVCEPDKGMVYWAEKEKGAFCKKGNKIFKMKVSDKNEFSQMRMLFSRNHLLDNDLKLFNLLKIGKQKRRGSTSKMCVIARGGAEIYVNTSNKTGLWDTCAVEIILSESGGDVTDTKGDPLKYDINKNLFNLNGFVASNGMKHENIIKGLKEILV